MKRIINTLLTLSVALGLYMPAAVAAERWEILRAINQVENPDNHTHYGPKGELGPYQFRRDTWRMYTRKPFTQANDRTSADAVAVSHYEALKRQLAEAGIAPTAFNVAMAWNCGINAVIAGRIPTVTYRYAEQVNNLADSYHAEAVAARQARPQELPVVHTALQSEFAVLFRSDGSIAQSFRVDADAPVLRVGGERPLFVLAPTEARLADAGKPHIALAF